MWKHSTNLRHIKTRNEDIIEIFTFLEIGEQTEEFTMTTTHKVINVGEHQEALMNGNQSNIVSGNQYNISGIEGNEHGATSSNDPASNPTKNDRSSPLSSGVYYLTGFILVLIALSIAGYVLPTFVLPVVIVGSLLALPIIGAFQLRQDGKVNEDNFLKLMALSFKYLPWLR